MVVVNLSDPKTLAEVGACLVGGLALLVLLTRPLRDPNRPRKPPPDRTLPDLATISPRERRLGRIVMFAINVAFLAFMVLLSKLIVFR